MIQPVTEQPPINANPKPATRRRRFGRFVLGGIVFVFALALGAGVLGWALSANQVCAAGGDSAPQGSNCLSPNPMPSTAPSITPATLQIGGSATISTQPGLNVRAGAGTASKIVTFLKDGARVTLVAGPQRANGYAWYEIRFGSPAKLGWVEARYLTPVTAPVKTSAPTPVTAPVKTSAPTPVGAYCVISVVSSANGVTAKDRVNTQNSDPCYSHWNVTIRSGKNSLGEPCGVQINGAYGSIGNGNIWNIVAWSEEPTIGLTDAFLNDGKILVLVCATVTRNEPQVTLYIQDWH